MNQTKETVPQSSNTEQTVASNAETESYNPKEYCNWLQDELRLAKAYWQEQIQPFINDRKLRNLEFEVARRAHSRLEETIANARQWNAGKWSLSAGKCNGNDGKQFPIPTEEFTALEKFRKPEPLLVDKSLKPEMLAVIAAPMIGKRVPKLLPSEAVRIAHDLLAAAQDYLDTLRKSQSRGLRERIVTGDNTVSFDEIEQSNRGDSGQLPLLPPIASKKKGRPEQEIREKPLSQTAIKDAVLLFLREHTASQGAIDDCLKTRRISLQYLCTMRWERFRKNSQVQQNRAISREAKKAEAKSKASKTKLPKSAASSPITVGKRKQ
jgi:hypothetical protein